MHIRKLIDKITFINSESNETSQILRCMHSTILITYIQVHGFFRKCNKNRAACNCAVSIKSNDDVVLFDHCGPLPSSKTPPLDIKVYRNGNFTANTYIIEETEGRKYRVR